MPIDATLLDASGAQQRWMPDPSGGFFDAAGDFDRLFDARADLPIWASIDPYGEVTIAGEEAISLIAELDALDTLAASGPEQRGLARLRAMAERCAADPSLRIRFRGD